MQDLRLLIIFVVSYLILLQRSKDIHPCQCDIINKEGPTDVLKAKIQSHVILIKPGFIPLNGIPRLHFFQIQVERTKWNVISFSLSNISLFFLCR